MTKEQTQAIPSKIIENLNANYFIQLCVPYTGIGNYKYNIYMNDPKNATDFNNYVNNLQNALGNTLIPNTETTVYPLCNDPNSNIKPTNITNIAIPNYYNPADISKILYFGSNLKYLSINTILNLFSLTTNNFITSSMTIVGSGFTTEWINKDIINIDNVFAYNALFSIIHANDKGQYLYESANPWCVTIAPSVCTALKAINASLICKNPDIETKLADFNSKYTNGNLSNNYVYQCSDKSISMTGNNNDCQLCWNGSFIPRSPTTCTQDKSLCPFMCPNLVYSDGKFGNINQASITGNDSGCDTICFTNNNSSSSVNTSMGLLNPTPENPYLSKVIPNGGTYNIQNCCHPIGLGEPGCDLICGSGATKNPECNDICGAIVDSNGNCCMRDNSTISNDGTTVCNSNDLIKHINNVNKHKCPGERDTNIVIGVLSTLVSYTGVGIVLNITNNIVDNYNTYNKRHPGENKGKNFLKQKTYRPELARVQGLGSDLRIRGDFTEYELYKNYAIRLANPVGHTPYLLRSFIKIRDVTKSDDTISKEIIKKKIEDREEWNNKKDMYENTPLKEMHPQDIALKESVAKYENIPDNQLYATEDEINNEKKNYINKARAKIKLWFPITKIEGTKYTDLNFFNNSILHSKKFPIIFKAQYGYKETNLVTGIIRELPITKIATLGVLADSINQLVKNCKELNNPNWITTAVTEFIEGAIKAGNAIDKFFTTGKVG